MYYLLFHLLNVPTTYHTFRKSSSFTQRPVTSQVDIITQKIEGLRGLGDLGLKLCLGPMPLHFKCPQQEYHYEVTCFEVQYNYKYNATMSILFKA